MPPSGKDNGDTGGDVEADGQNTQWLETESGIREPCLVVFFLRSPFADAVVPFLTHQTHNGLKISKLR